MSSHLECIKKHKTTHENSLITNTKNMKAKEKFEAAIHNKHTKGIIKGLDLAIDILNGKIC